MMNLAIIFQGNWSSKYFSAIHTTRIFDQFTTSVWLYARCFHPNLSPKDARTQLVVFSEFLEEMDKWWTLIILFVIFSINILYTNLVKMFEFFEDCSCLKYSRHFFSRHAYSTNNVIFNFFSYRQQSLHIHTTGRSTKSTFFWGYFTYLYNIWHNIHDKKRFNHIA